ncbi:unnamed protein product [Rhizophagus irregularis]|nr:unnamed protein product [Rhizophagus irregularis]
MKEITLAIRYMPYPHTGNAIQQVLEEIISEWKLQTKQNERLIDAQKNSDENLEKSDLHSVFYKAITDVETRWSSTYIAWERLIILQPYIDIVISSLNASKDRDAKEDAKRLKIVNLTNEEWDVIRDLLEILGPFAKLTEKLEDLDTNDNAFEEHQFEEDDEDDEPGARRKIKINTLVNTSGLVNNIKVNLYKALEKYYEVIEKEALVATLLARFITKKNDICK